MITPEASAVEITCFILVASLVAYRAWRRRAVVLHRSERDGLVVIVRDRGGARELVFASDRPRAEMLQSRARLTDGAPPVSGIPYTDGLHLAALACEAPRRALVVGGGAFVVPRQLVAQH